MKLSRSIVERAPVTDVYVIFRQKLWGPVNEVKIPKLTFEFYIKKKKTPQTNIILLEKGNYINCYAKEKLTS